jgi:hypothetical protein
MIRISITQAAFDAIAATLLFGSVNYETKISAKGKRLIWLDVRVVNRLRAQRGPGESYSDIILRLAPPSDATRPVHGPLPMPLTQEVLNEASAHAERLVAPSLVAIYTLDQGFRSGTDWHGLSDQPW